MATAEPSAAIFYIREAYTSAYSFLYSATFGLVLCLCMEAVSPNFIFHVLKKSFIRRYLNKDEAK